MPTIYDVFNSITHPHGSIAGDKYAADIPLLTRENITEVGNIILGNPVSYNWWIDNLIGRIGETIVMLCKAQPDPFAVFGYSTLRFGDTVQRIYFHLPEMKNYDGTDTTQMLEQEDVRVEVEYIKIDRRFYYKRTISAEELRTAFLNAVELERFIRDIIESMFVKYKWDVYVMTAAMMKDAVEKEYSYPDHGNCLIIPESITQYDNTNKVYVDWDPVGAKSLLKILKSVVPMLGYMHTRKYYKDPTDTTTLVEIPVITERQDAVFGLEIDPMIEMDVDALAVLFHLDKAKLPDRIIELQNNVFGSTSDGAYHVAGFVINKNLVDRRINLELTETFLNRQSLRMNVWKHYWGFMALSLFGDFMPILVKNKVTA